MKEGSAMLLCFRNALDMLVYVLDGCRTENWFGSLVSVVRFDWIGRRDRSLGYF